MPPILPGGDRDYESARLVLDRFKTSHHLKDRDESVKLPVPTVRDQLPQ